MSKALKEKNPLANLMKEINGVFPLCILKPTLILKVQEDNQCCITIANNPKFYPRTKHIALKYHHFRHHINTQSNPGGFIEIVYCSTHNQLADIFTRPTTNEVFFKLRKKRLGW
jgi:hypothetical protein